MELSKNDTKMIQGLSVLAMIWLHLFCKDYTGLYTPIIFAGGTPLSFYIAQLCDFCVFGFAFCSGYAHTVQYEETGYYKKRLKGLLSVLVSYWIVLITFSIVSVIAGQADFMPGNLRKFIMNFLTLDNSYNGAWWYMFAYAVLVIISPILLKCVKKLHPIIVLSIGFLVYCAAYYIRFNLGYSNWFLGKLGPFGMTLFEYLLGAECCKLKVFTKIHKIWIKVPKVARCILAIIMIIAMLYARTSLVPSLFVAPITGLAIITLFHFWEKPKFVKKIFLTLGKHSTNLWLTHMFFYSVMFVNLVYIAKYPLLIFAFMLAITLSISFVLQTLERPLKKFIIK